ncbi:MAG: hypothetical protein WKF83_00780 [Nocardioidaceae bacterium]
MRRPTRTAIVPAAMIGAPDGVSGTRPTAMAAASRAMRRCGHALSRGHSRARNAAPTAASSPYLRGSPSAVPATAPASVITFHSTKTAAPVT